MGPVLPEELVIGDGDASVRPAWSCVTSKIQRKALLIQEPTGDVQLYRDLLKLMTLLLDYVNPGPIMEHLGETCCRLLSCA